MEQGEDEKPREYTAIDVHDHNGQGDQDNIATEITPLISNRSNETKHNSIYYTAVFLQESLVLNALISIFGSMIISSAMDNNNSIKSAKNKEAMEIANWSIIGSSFVMALYLTSQENNNGPKRFQQIQDFLSFSKVVLILEYILQKKMSSISLPLLISLIAISSCIGFATSTCFRPKIEEGHDDQVKNTLSHSEKGVFIYIAFQIVGIASSLAILASEIERQLEGKTVDSKLWYYIVPIIPIIAMLTQVYSLYRNKTEITDKRLKLFHTSTAGLVAIYNMTLAYRGSSAIFATFAPNLDKTMVEALAIPICTIASLAVAIISFKLTEFPFSDTMESYNKITSRVSIVMDALKDQAENCLIYIKNFSEEEYAHGLFSEEKPRDLELQDSSHVEETSFGSNSQA